MQDKIDRIIELATIASELCAPLKVYRYSGGRQRFLEEPEIDLQRALERPDLSGEWQNIKLSMPPYDNNLPLYSGPSGHYLTWQQCLDLTDAFQEFKQGKDYRLSPLSLAFRAEAALSSLRPVDIYREAALHQHEVTGMPILQPEAQYFPGLKNRPELVLGEPDLYHIVCAYAEGAKLAGEIKAELARSYIAAPKPASPANQ